jgi:hypothetical protein
VRRTQVLLLHGTAIREILLAQAGSLGGVGGLIHDCLLWTLGCC